MLLEKQQSQLNSQKKTNKSIIIVTEELNQDLELDRKLTKRNWKIVIAEKEDNASQVINKTTKSSGKDCTIHLIAHGEPGYLYLGSGISLIELKNIADKNLEDNQKLTIWGCEVAKNSSEAINQSSKVKAPETKLGQGKTIEGYGELTKAVNELNYQLEKWKSGSNLIKAEKSPKFIS